MNILTPSGYKDIADCHVGDEVCAFDIASGAPIINLIEMIEPVDLSEWQRWHQTWDEVPPFQWVLVNGTHLLFCEQSIWIAPDVCTHAKLLQVGQTIYDDANNDLLITSIDYDAVGPDTWTRLEISGDHSFISDGLTLHNASRFWVGGTGTWDNSATTHWSGSSGGGNGSSAPGSSDTATLDGASGGGTVTPNATLTLQSITCGAFTGTLDFSANNNNVTLGVASGNALNGSGTGARTINLGNGTFAFSGSGVIINFANTTGLTFNANSSVISISGTTSFSRSMQTGGQTWATINIGANTSKAPFTFGTGATITTLGITAPNVIVFPSGATTTVTNALTTGGSSLSDLLVLHSSSASGSLATYSSANNVALSWCSLEDLAFTGGGTFSATNSIDLSQNTGITITPPSAGGGGIGSLINGSLLV